MKISFNNKQKLKCDNCFCHNTDVDVLIKAKITVKSGSNKITTDTQKYCPECFRLYILPGVFSSLHIGGVGRGCKMSSFSNRLRICINALEAGHEIELESGHKLVWVGEYEGPGFVGYNDTSKGQLVIQINSDVAWRELILHARNMSKDDAFVLGAEAAMTKMNRERHGVRK